MEKLYRFIKLVFIVFLITNIVFGCDKEDQNEEDQKHERRILNVSIREDFNNYDISLTVDSSMINACFHEIIEEGYLPLVIELYDNETISNVGSNATFDGNVIELDLSGLTMQFDGPPVGDNLITVFTIDDIDYLIQLIFEQDPGI